MDLILTQEQSAILDKIEADLRANKVRLTKGRRDILRIILSANHPTMGEIVDYLAKIDRVKPNIMSVYNTINMLLANHVIYANTFDGKQIRYEVRITEAGHLKCDNCLRMIHMDQLQTLNADLQKLANKYQWTCDHFKLEIHGLCPRCRTSLTF